MTGLEKILSQIDRDADMRCDELEKNARKKAEQLLNDAAIQAEKIASLSAEQTEKTLDTLSRSADSAAQLTRSRTLLKAKLDIINSALESSLENIKALDKSEYFAFIKELIIKNAKPGEGVLRFCKKDKGRLPDGFVSELCSSINPDCKIVLGDEADIDSGFILTYGDIDINCSFDAIAAEKRDEIKDALNSILFN